MPTRFVLSAVKGFATSRLARNPNPLQREAAVGGAGSPAHLLGSTTFLLVVRLCPLRYSRRQLAPRTPSSLTSFCLCPQTSTSEPPKGPLAMPEEVKRRATVKDMGIISYPSF